MLFFWSHLQILHPKKTLDNQEQPHQEQQPTQSPKSIQRNTAITKEPARLNKTEKGHTQKNALPLTAEHANDTLTPRHTKSHQETTQQHRIKFLHTGKENMCLCVCVPIAIPAISLGCLVVVVLIAAVSSTFPRSMCTDDRSKRGGFQSQKRKGYMTGQVWKEELLAKATTIDGRKEWYCRFCSETNVCTRSK